MEDPTKIDAEAALDLLAEWGLLVLAEIHSDKLAIHTIPMDAARDAHHSMAIPIDDDGQIEAFNIRPVIPWCEYLIKAERMKAHHSGREAIAEGQPNGGGSVCEEKLKAYCSTRHQAWDSMALVCGDPDFSKKVHSAAAEGWEAGWEEAQRCTPEAAS